MKKLTLRGRAGHACSADSSSLKGKPRGNFKKKNAKASQNGMNLLGLCQRGRKREKVI